MKTFVVLITCCATLLFVPLVSSDETVQQQLTLFLQNTTSIQADFQQVSFDKQGNPAETSEGTFYLNRPGRFRWHYQHPFIQEIVSNGDKIWFYDADLEQVTIKPAIDSIGSTPALLLSGNVKLNEEFHVIQHGQTEGDMAWIKLTPKKEESGFNYILIGLDKGILAGMELSDNFGQLTRIYFSNLQQNPELSDTLFSFNIPEGVDVFSQ